MASVVILTYDLQTVVKTEDTDQFIYKNFTVDDQDYIGDTVGYPYLKVENSGGIKYVLNPGNKTEQTIYTDFNGFDRSHFAYISLKGDSYRWNNQTYLNNASYFQTVDRNTISKDVEWRKISGQPQQIVQKNYCIEGKSIAAYGPQDMSQKSFLDPQHPIADYFNEEKEESGHIGDNYTYKYFGFRKPGLQLIGTYVSTLDILSDLINPENEDYILVHCGSPLYSYNMSRTSNLTVTLSCTSPSKISVYTLKYKPHAHISPWQEYFWKKTEPSILNANLTVTSVPITFSSVENNNAMAWNDVSGTIIVPVLQDYPNSIWRNLSISETNVNMYFFVRGKSSTQPTDSWNAMFFENLESSNYNNSISNDKILWFNDSDGRYEASSSYCLGNFTYYPTGLHKSNMYGKNYLLKVGSKGLPIIFKCLDNNNILNSHPRSYWSEKVFTARNVYNPSDIYQINYLSPVFSNRSSMPDEDRYLSPFLGYKVNESSANLPQPIVCVYSGDDSTINLFKSWMNLESHTQTPDFLEIRNKSTNISWWYYNGDNFYFTSLNTVDRGVEENFPLSSDNDFCVWEDHKGFLYLFKISSLIGD